ncbi:aminotransferase-like domain-containing protein [Celerinatantimonas diazotrophica]|uniref:GntR family transcriptional regulator n=1 Tax=Celerinatantimonas diazotrophica TaxID=412034 RepID=A0A4R1K2M8_9GAMM|nr:PLP-dependent aminotransferase family protein [Celerinatantimonas diazotrophica]TCK58097.1 GntR family transcriptional regulator [Celerinatantimonas diazotrophica]CAG9297831.1 Histidinol-phosphate aminotransferase [Celerinatantimonas diazotrophica]
MTILKMGISKNDSRAIYKQVADQLSVQIEEGLLKPNEKLPTHRALADKLQVTVGTITRAYAEAERRGLVEARVGSGTYVVDKKKVYWEFQHSTAEQIKICNFGYNMPPSVGQSDKVKKAMQVLSESSIPLNEFLAYQKPEGIESHRKIVAQWLQDHGRKIDPDRLLFTSGVQHGIQMVFDAFTDVGDTILTEKLTYPGLFSLSRRKKLNLRGVEMDEEGIIPKSLDAACQHYQPRFLYVIPTLQNPTTSTMSALRRQEIISICEKYNVLIIEDDVNGLLPDNLPEPLVNLDPERVLHLGSFSKYFAPGLRVGYIQSPHALHSRLKMTLKDHSWMLSPLLSGLICELICSKNLDWILDKIRHEVAQRAQIALNILQRCVLKYQHGGFHIWLSLPDTWRLSDFIHAAEQRGVVVKSAENFTLPAGTVTPAIRVSIGCPSNRKQMMQGLTILKELLKLNTPCDFAL